jgi:hypothetical protein
MKRKTTFSAIGGYQPFFFCIGMYFVALFFSIFICSAIFYAANPKKTIAKSSKAPAHRLTTLPAGSKLLLTVTK